MKVRELLTDESKWTQGFDARSKSGRRVDWESRAAVRWCLLGAVYYCYGTDKDYARVFDLIKGEVGPYIATWNDTSGRTFADVRALIEKLDI